MSQVCARCKMIPGPDQPACSRTGNGEFICFRCGYLGEKVPPLTIPMLLICPGCGKRHIDGVANDGTDWAAKLHHTHACQHCGHVWRPAIANTVGVQFLPGFKNDG